MAVAVRVPQIAPCINVNSHESLYECARQTSARSVFAKGDPVMRLKVYLVLVTALWGWAGAAAATTRPEVTVAEGRLSGIAEAGLHVFKGIPYALPPV